MYVMYVDSNPVAKPSRDPLTKKGHCDWPDELISLSFFTINYKLLLLIKNK